jgi:hypothetical protein
MNSWIPADQAVPDTNEPVIILTEGKPCEGQYIEHLEQWYRGENPVKVSKWMPFPTE